MNRYYYTHRVINDRSECVLMDRMPELQDILIFPYNMTQYLISKHVDLFNSVDIDERTKAEVMALLTYYRGLENGNV